ncbi:MAG: primosomal protein N', partial [Candidatus Enteromonas sp.]|nr:primosomal protein N' [Candidatus Enteromonas sp.]
LESRARAQKGLYEFVRLTKRVNERALPKTSIIDLSKRKVIYAKYDIFSDALVSKIKEKLEKQEQIVLLLNRRGYSPYIGCHDCGYVYTCPNCGSFLSYHKADEMLKCHHCDYVQKYPDSCPECGSHKIKRTGYGTERVIKKLAEIFPSARIARLDSDVSKVRTSMQSTLEGFRHHEFDILVGTQMIAKGHDFPLVTLVGVVQADIGLYSPSYRASENTFELLAQAVGRAGRSTRQGEAIIQTYNANNYAITYGASQDYEGFYLKEMETRRIGKLPPYVYLVVIRVKSKNEEKANEASFQIKENLEGRRFENVMAVGPATPYIAIQGGYYIKTILVKYRKRDELFPYLIELQKKLSGRAGIEIEFDVDPLDY